jgi:hypothetical protein
VVRLWACLWCACGRACGAPVGVPVVRWFFFYISIDKH